MNAPATHPAFELREPVTLVLTSGREVFHASNRLMHALDVCDGKVRRVLAIREGEREATARAVAGLNTYLDAFGLHLIKKQEGPGKWPTRYGWSALKAVVGMEFEGANVVVARLPAGPYFGAPAHPALLVACWDGGFDNLVPLAR